MEQLVATFPNLQRLELLYQLYFQNFALPEEDPDAGLQYLLTGTCLKRFCTWCMRTFASILADWHFERD